MELKPCPFCGGTRLEGPIFNDSSDYKSGYNAWIECLDETCGAFMQFYEPDRINAVMTVAMRWNRRDLPTKAES